MKSRVMLSKSELRDEIKRHVADLSPNNKMVESTNVWQKVEQLPQFLSSSHILAYWSMASEVYSHLFVDKWATQKKVYLPLVVGDRLELVMFESRNQLEVNRRYGIWEPRGEWLTDLSVIQFMLVPGIAFDSAGVRLGRGGGFYDRLMPQLKCAFKVGVAFGCQMVAKVPVEPHDAKLDIVITGM